MRPEGLEVNRPFARQGFGIMQAMRAEGATLSFVDIGLSMVNPLKA
jgi:hypothetical protein